MEILLIIVAACVNFIRGKGRVRVSILFASVSVACVTTASVAWMAYVGRFSIREAFDLVVPLSAAVAAICIASQALGKRSAM